MLCLLLDALYCRLQGVAQVSHPSCGLIPQLRLLNETLIFQVYFQLLHAVQFYVSFLFLEGLVVFLFSCFRLPHVSIKLHFPSVRVYAATVLLPFHTAPAV